MQRDIAVNPSPEARKLLDSEMRYRTLVEWSPDPVLVHRIDRDTSGIILIAKNKRVLRFLHTHFREHQIDTVQWRALSHLPR